MKRTLALLAAATLTASLAGTSVAAVKKPAPPKPVKITYYFHGTNTAGEADQALVGGTGLMKMDATKPSGAQEKTFGVTNYGGGPNTKCAGNSLFPNWVGAGSGNLTGTASVTLFSYGMATSAVKVQIFGDTEAQACNEAYPTPLGETTVTLPSGPGSMTVKIPIIGKGKISSSFTVQVQPVTVPPHVTRIRYDSAATPSSITVSCLPKVGKKTC